MAEAPMCKICDPPRRHWKNEPHVLREKPDPFADRPLRVPGSSVVSPGPVVKAVPVSARSVKVPAGKKVVLRDVAETRAYMRQYMRDRTVAKKLGLTVKEYRARRKEREG